MNLVPHIFRKDVRHFYPEILVYLALLIAFGLATPISWGPGYAATFDRLATAILPFLIPVIWLVMVARLVHDEALVGDRQFWITRPYSWPALLLAKLLFLLVSLHLPLLLVQAYLLHYAHLSIGPALPDLLQYQGIVALVYVLPLLAMSVVTASFGRLLLSILAGLLYIIGVGVIASRLSFHSISLPFMSDACGVIVVLVLVGVVLAMYARRPEKQARLALLLLPVVLLIVVFAAPTSLLVHHAYAASYNQQVLAFDPDPRQQQPATSEPLPFDHDVLLQLPIQFQPSPAQREIGINGAQLTLRAADGFTWRSAYQSERNFTATSSPEHIGLYMPATTYERLRSEPLTFELRLAVQPYTLGTPTTVTVPASRTFAAPGHGLCQPMPDGGSVQCRYPLRDAPPAVTTLEVQDGSCNSNGQSHSFTYLGSTSDGLHFGLDPVALEYIPLQEVILDRKHFLERTPHFVCPGAKVVFTPRTQGQRYEVILTQPAVRLPLYVMHKETLKALEEPED